MNGDTPSSATPDSSASAANGLIITITNLIRQVIGVPDHERYLAHMRLHHPGESPLDAREFARDALTRRYGRPGSRCC